ncbi:hypothetical protein, partial [Dysgonomonas sp. UBA7698]|uniref:hypothetical protein n=1 Tax=Dysgonomonas sp. UBA7698 TaxID=1946427 RepID=UPI0025C2EB98
SSKKCFEHKITSCYKQNSKKRVHHHKRSDFFRPFFIYHLPFFYPQIVLATVGAIPCGRPNINGQGQATAPTYSSLF